MKLLVENWSLIVALGAAIAIAVIRVRNYLKMSKAEQEAAIQKHKDDLIKGVNDWLLRGVTEAEKELGAETGKLKLRAVYERAIELFGSEIAEIFTLEQFDELVQKPLEELRKMLESNDAVKDYVNGLGVTVHA